MVKKKKLFKWAAGIVLTPILLAVVLLVLLYIPPIQNWAVQRVAAIASEKTGMQITVGRVSLAFPLDLAVSNVSVVQQEDTVASIGRAVVDVKLWPLFSSKVVVDRLEIQQAQVNTMDFLSDLQVKGQLGSLSLSSKGIDLSRETIDLTDVRLHNADLTVLLSDTAQVDTTTSETMWQVGFNQIEIENARLCLHMPADSMRITVGMGQAQVLDGQLNLGTGQYHVGHFAWHDGTVGYDIPYEPRQTEGLDVNHLLLTQLAMDVDSLHYADPLASLIIRHAAATEQSGLQITRLNGAIRMDAEGLRLPGLQLCTPHSDLYANASVDFSMADSIVPGQLSAQLDARLGEQDLSLLAGGLPSQWPHHPLTVKGHVSGNMQHATIHQLDVTLPTVFRAQASGWAKALTDVNRMAATLQLEAQTYGALPLSADAQIPAGLRLHGQAQADGPHYALNAVLTDAQGGARMAATLHQRTMSYTADVSIDSLNLRHFMPTGPLGELSATATVTGRGTDFLKPRTQLEAEARIGSLQYEAWQLGDMSLCARLHDQYALLNVEGHNALLDGEVSLDAQLDSHSLMADLTTDLNKLDLRALSVSDDPLIMAMNGHIALASDLEQSHRLNGLIKNFVLNDSASTFAPEAIQMAVETRPDTIHATIQSGDFLARLMTSGGYETVLGQIGALADSLSAQLERRSLNQQAIRQMLPVTTLHMESGRDNPVNHFLRSYANIDFKQLQADFSSSPASGLNGNAHLFSLNADSTRIDTIRFQLRDTDQGLTYNGQVTNNRRNPQFVFNALLDGRLYEQQASIGVRYYDERGVMGARIGAMVSVEDNGFRFHLLPERPLLGYKEFKLNADNFLFIRNDLKLQAKVDLIADDGTGVKVYSEEQDSTLLQDLTVSLYRFDLASISSVMPYMPRITGELEGDFHLVMNEQQQISIASGVQVKAMTYEQCPMGDLSTEFVYLQRQNETHALEARLLRNDVEIGIFKGEYRDEGAGYLDANLELEHLPMDMMNGFIPDQLFGFQGYLEGEVSVKGSLRYPQANGEIYMDSAALVSQPYGVRLRFDQDPVRVIDSKLLLENFTMYANNDNPINILGEIDFHDTNHMTMNMRMGARNFLLIDAKRSAKSIAYGKMFVNWFAFMQGPTDQLKMRGKLDVLGTTDLTYTMLDSPLSTDNQLEELVKFTDFSDTTQTVVDRPTPDGLDVDLSISIDQGAHVLCNLNVDQTNYIDIMGGGDLRLHYDANGINLTGRYTLTSGEMKYSLPIIPLKTFTIQDGSYVEFTGDPANPRLNLTATERTKATVGQDGDQTRSVAFDCGVVITKTLNDMGLEFIISAPEDMAVSSDLNSMSTEQRGKLAVTMLTTGMYLADGNTGGFSMNSALSSFLQSEINNITGNALKTLDLSIGLDNTTDASGAMHTDYSFKFAKRFWNNRLKVQIGGKVSTGTEATQGQNQSFFDNVTMEYRLSQTSNQYVKLFYNQNAYDWLEGYTGEYGGGYIWKRKLDSLWDIFRRSRGQATPVRPSAGKAVQPANSTKTTTTQP